MTELGFTGYPDWQRTPGSELSIQVDREMYRHDHRDMIVTQPGGRTRLIIEGTDDRMQPYLDRLAQIETLDDETTTPFFRCDDPEGQWIADQAAAADQGSDPLPASVGAPALWALAHQLETTQGDLTPEVAHALSLVAAAARTAAAVIVTDDDNTRPTDTRAWIADQAPNPDLANVETAELWASVHYNRYNDPTHHMDDAVDELARRASTLERITGQLWDATKPGNLPLWWALADERKAQYRRKIATDGLTWADHPVRP